MSEIQDLSFLKTLAIEIGPDCNFRRSHKICPACHLNRPEDDSVLSDAQIYTIMDDAVALGFQGHFAFHFYNEPLLYIHRIARLKKMRSHYKFLLWSNGVLSKKAVKKGYNLNIFDKIIFTCYHNKYKYILEEIAAKHGNVEIFDPEMDDRLHIYDSEAENLLSCRKIYYELPIDYQGTVYICTYDWRKQHVLGNVTQRSLADIVMGEEYQNLLRANARIFHDHTVPALCKRCPRPYRGAL